jgi:hypothetical protein
VALIANLERTGGSRVRDGQRCERDEYDRV